jgi:hypothetical protein
VTNETLTVYGGGDIGRAIGDVGAVILFVIHAISIPVAVALVYQTVCIEISAVGKRKIKLLTGTRNDLQRIAGNLLFQQGGYTDRPGAVSSKTSAGFFHGIEHGAARGIKTAGGYEGSCGVMEGEVNGYLTITDDLCRDGMAFLNVKGKTVHIASCQSSKYKLSLERLAGIPGVVWLCFEQAVFTEAMLITSVSAPSIAIIALLPFIGDRIAAHGFATRRSARIWQCIAVGVAVITLFIGFDDAVATGGKDFLGRRRLRSAGQKCEQKKHRRNIHQKFECIA